MVCVSSTVQDQELNRYVFAALTWFSTHFLKCNDRVQLVRSWLPETTIDGPSWLGQLVYDRALQLVCLPPLFLLNSYQVFTVCLFSPARLRTWSW